MQPTTTTTEGLERLAALVFGSAPLPTPAPIGRLNEPSHPFELAEELTAVAGEAVSDVRSILELPTFEPLTPAQRSLAEEMLGAVHRLQALAALFAATAEVEARP